MSRSHLPPLISPTALPAQACSMLHIRRQAAISRVVLHVLDLDLDEEALKLVTIGRVCGMPTIFHSFGLSKINWPITLFSHVVTRNGKTVTGMGLQTQEGAWNNAPDLNDIERSIQPLRAIYPYYFHVAIFPEEIHLRPDRAVNLPIAILDDANTLINIKTAIAILVNSLSLEPAKRMEVAKLAPKKAEAYEAFLTHRSGRPDEASGLPIPFVWHVFDCAVLSFWASRSSARKLLPRSHDADKQSVGAEQP